MLFMMRKDIEQPKTIYVFTYNAKWPLLRYPTNIR